MVPCSSSSFCSRPRARALALRPLDRSRRCRPFADDEPPRLLVLGAVPMHLLAEVGDEGAGPHRHHVLLVDLVAGRDPPGSLENGDEAIVGMEMRLAEIARLEAI